LTQTHNGLAPNPNLPGAVSIRRWFGFYAILLAAAIAPLVLSIRQDAAPFAKLGEGMMNSVKTVGPLLKRDLAAAKTRMKQAGNELENAMGMMRNADKLLVFAIYLSICTTFTPMPTGWLVSALAIRQTAIGDSIWSTTAIVSLVGAAATTIANLNDYHLFLWLLRSRRVAAVRNTKTYLAAQKWFAKGPFTILMIFNVLYIPVDVPRMFAALYGYPRVQFAAANFIGRWLRYVIIAAVTYMLGDKGWIALVALLALAVVLAMVKIVPMIWKRFFDKGSNTPPIASDGVNP